MTTYICLLKGINVSGQKIIHMADVIADFEDLGFKNVITYLQSGNVVFDTPDSDISKIHQRIELRMIQSYGFVVAAIMRTEEEWRSVLSSNPFLAQKEEEIDRLYVTFLANSPAETAIKKIKRPEGIHDRFAIQGKEIYLYCPNGYGTTKLSTAFFEKKLNITATTRSWKTVTALEEIAR